MLSKLTVKPGLVAEHDKNSLFPDALRLLGPLSDMSDIYRLRYRAYRDAGWIGHRDDAMLQDRFDVLPGTLSLAAYSEQGCICAFRLNTDGGNGPSGALPSAAVFPEILAGLKDSGLARIAELGRLAVEPNLPNRSFRATLLMSIVRAAGVLCYATGVEYTVVAVHERLSNFYRGLFGFELLGKSEDYNGILEPTHFLGRSLYAMDEPHSTRNQFFAIDKAELEQARMVIAALRNEHYEREPGTAEHWPVAST